MADFYKRIDVGGLSAFTLVEFLFDSSEQTVHNDNANASAVVEVSFDGVQPHARLQGTGPSKVIHWSDHVRNKMWLRQVAGPGSSHFVEILAVTR